MTIGGSRSCTRSPAMATCEGSVRPGGYPPADCSAESLARRENRGLHRRHHERLRLDRGRRLHAVRRGWRPCINVTPDMRASATSLDWSCDGHLLAQLLAGEKTQIVDLGSGRRALLPPVSCGAARNRSRTAMPADLMACPSGVPPRCTNHSPHRRRSRSGRSGTGAISLNSVNAGLSACRPRAESVMEERRLRRAGVAAAAGTCRGKMPLVTIIHGGPAAAAAPSFSGPGAGADRCSSAATRCSVRIPAAASVRVSVSPRPTCAILATAICGICWRASTRRRKARPSIPQRLGITGGSYGGFMTMWAVTQTDRFKAAVAAAGISDWLSYYGENGIDAWMLPYFGASVYDDPAVYAQSSPINFIRNVAHADLRVRGGTRHRVPRAADPGVLARTEGTRRPDCRS